VTIVIVPAVGDFVEPGTPLFHVYGAAQIPERTLHAGIRLGPARTVEQDPLFALRLLVDVAVRALSPAVNDPYTGVQSLDRIAQLLTVIGGAILARAGESIARERFGSGTPRRTGTTTCRLSEIRGFRCPGNAGRTSLAAVLLRPRASVPSDRRPALETQLRLLKLLLRVHSPTRPSALRR
jgi:hypothetical protein